jgi:hypothetical protein
MTERRDLLAPESLGATSLSMRKADVLRLEDVAPTTEELRQSRPVDTHAHDRLSSLMILTRLCSGIH